MNESTRQQVMNYACPFCGHVVWAFMLPQKVVPSSQAGLVLTALEQVVSWHMETHVAEMMEAPE